MMLFIKVNEDDPNWQGYNFVVNRKDVKEETTTLERSLGGWSWEVVTSDIQYKVVGNKMELAIPRKHLGLKSGKIDIQFKWNDNMQEEGDIYDFILNGDTAPNNRFNYRYTEKETPSSFTRNLYTIAGNEDNKVISKGDTISIKFDAEHRVKGLDIFLSPPSWQLVDDKEKSIKYSGTWGNIEDSNYYNDTLHFSNVSGSSITFTFTGTGVRWIGDKASDRGIVDIYVDGELVDTVDTFSTQLLHKQVLFETTGLEDKEHELKIVITDKMGKDALGTYQSVDYLEYLPAYSAKSSSFEYRIYKWKDNYKDSVSKWAVKSGTVKNTKSNEWISLKKTDLKEGEYILVIKAKGDLSISSYDANYDNVTFYVDGKEQQGCLKARVKYAIP